MVYCFGCCFGPCALGVPGGECAPRGAEGVPSGDVHTCECLGYIRFASAHEQALYVYEAGVAHEEVLRDSQAVM